MPIFDVENLLQVFVFPRTGASAFYRPKSYYPVCFQLYLAVHCHSFMNEINNDDDGEEDLVLAALTTS